MHRTKLSRRSLWRPLAAAFTLALYSVTAFAADQDDPWAHRAWIAKAGRVMRGGAPLTESEIEALAPMDRQQVIDALMADPRFGDAALDLSMFFLGVKPAQLWRPDFDDQTGVSRAYDFMVYEKPQAIAAAQAAAAGSGDFFQLFDDVHVRYMEPMRSPYVEPVPDQPPLSDAEKRRVLRTRLDAGFDRVLGVFMRQDGSIDRGAGCQLFRGDGEGFSDVMGPFFDSGFAGPINFDLMSIPGIQMNLDCGTPQVTDEQLVARLREWKAALGRLYDAAENFAGAAYRVTAVSDIATLPQSATDPFLKGTSYEPLGFWYQLPNSSTNYNRKRAAYMLRTYFCDDLTPLGVVPGDDTHVGDGHASDPSCQSCHYKLDPMAGFFKDRGVLGFEFADRPFIVFDDNAVFLEERLAAYRNSWPTTGYIRSTRDTTRNDYGSSLADLSSILRRAPEVKQCLTRRMAEYVLGKDQVFDGGWLTHLAQRFDDQTMDSATAFRGVLRELLTSNTFTAPDPRPDECYDFYPPDQRPALPCAVAHMIRNSCASCHASTAARNGGLDLTKWQTIGTWPNGSPRQGFPHLDRDGRQLAPGDSFQSIADRLNSADPNRSMPRNRDMNAADKARLYRWALDEAQAQGE